MSQEKKWIEYEFLNIFTHQMSLKVLEETLELAKAAELSGEWKNIRLAVENGYEGDIDVFLVGERLETDQEHSLRLYQEGLRKDMADKQEKELFLRLKKKYETV